MLRRLTNIENFLDTQISNEELPSPENYIRGSQRICYYPEKLNPHIDIDCEHLAGSYEDALFDRFFHKKQTPLALIGGVGSGKSSAIRHIIHRIQHSFGTGSRLSPILIDITSLRKDDSLTQVVSALFRQIYIKTLDQISDRMRTQPAPEKHRHIHRNLALWLVYQWAVRQDILEFPLTPTPGDFDIKSAAYEDRADDDELFATLENDDTFNQFMESFRSQRMNLELRQQQQLVECVLAYFSRQSQALFPPPFNTLIVDNIDQLSSDTITNVFNRLHSIKRNVPHLRVILPLRPSSISIDGYVANAVFMYHYGPNCFDLVMHRARKAILARSEPELIAGTADQPRAFINHPSDDEVKTFILATYIYCSILATGSSSGRYDLAGTLNALVLKHDWLSNVEVINQERTDNIREGIGALIGTSARYAIRHSSRFYTHLYEVCYDYMSDIVRKLRIADNSKDKQDRRKIKIGYGRIIQMCLAHATKEKLNKRHFINMFMPVAARTNLEWPTAVTLRILDYLRVHRRKEVGDVIRHMAEYGIPEDVTVQTLNYLHKSERHLCWFSTNSDISPRNGSKEHVVISEQGVGYATALASNFEYTWICGAELNPTLKCEETYADRLLSYKFLTRRLLHIDWKQTIFYLLSSNRVVPPSGLSVPGRLISLQAILRSGAAAIFSAAQNLRRRHSYSYRNDVGIETYADHVDSIVSEYIHTIRQGQNFHCLAFGSETFLRAYRSEVESLRTAIHEIQNIREFRVRAASVACEDIVRSWNILGNLDSSTVALALHSPTTEDRPETDPISRMAKLAMTIPVRHLQQFSESASNMLMVDLAKERYDYAEGQVRELFMTRLPLFEDALRAARRMKDIAEQVLSTAEKRGITVETDHFRFFHKVKAEWERVHGDIEKCRYAVHDDASSKHVTELKQKFNGLLECYENVVRLARGDVAKTEHLAVRWWEAYQH